MMQAVWTSETLVNLYQSTWRYNTEDSHLCIHRHENLKSGNWYTLQKKLKYVFFKINIVCLQQDLDIERLNQNANEQQITEK
jgi:hypothetical protein